MGCPQASMINVESTTLHRKEVTKCLSGTLAGFYEHGDESKDSIRRRNLLIR
jgi:hypothetical protein